MSKILIIEDEPAIRRVLIKILSEEDKSHEIDEAENGIDAINHIKKNSYDLIISDIKMPKVDGMEVLDYSKKNTPETPIIMISGHGDLELAVDSMKKGAFDYISKPPDLNRLLTTVRNALDIKQLVVENKLLRKKISKNFEMIGKITDGLSTMNKEKFKGPLQLYVPLNFWFCRNIGVALPLVALQYHEVEVELEL